ncbi:hypothetical protein JHK85_016637 [Glycine max]|nr:hypothetical protein JHK85_016637 [Glycine max]
MARVALQLMSLLVFPRGSPLLPSANQALLNISESGTLCDLENSMLASDKCKHIIDPGAETTSLSPASFMLLFIIDPACKCNLEKLGYVALYPPQLEFPPGD